MFKIKRFLKRNYKIIKIGKDIGLPDMKFKAYNKMEVFRTKQLGNEERALKYFISILKSDDIIYDIGASIGLVTISSALISNKGNVLSFEPDIDTYKRLNENIEFNRLKNVQTFQFAISNTNQVCSLHTSGTDGFSPSLVVHKAYPDALKNEIEIKTEYLDNLIENRSFPIPDVIKIDIEGAELLCLLGAEKLMNGKFGRKPKHIFIEVHPEYLPDFNHTKDDVLNFFLKTDYHIQWQESRSQQIHIHYILKD